MRWLRGGIALGGLLAASGLAFGQPATGGLGPGLAAGYITAVTQPAGDNSTKVATTAFTAAAVGIETSRATTAEGLLAPKASPALTGNTTIGGTLGVTGAATFSGGMTGTLTGTATNLSGTPTLPSGTVLPGYETTAAAALLAPLASPTFTGTVTAPTFSGTLTGHASLDLPLTGGTVTGDTTFSGAGTGLAVTNNATIGGTLGVTGNVTAPSLALTGSVAQSSVLAGPSGAAGAPTQRVLGVADVTGAAPLASPAFTGTPTVPGYLTTAVAGTTYAPLASPALTGTPTAPTETTTDTSTDIATDAFAHNVIAIAIPSVATSAPECGTGAAGAVGACGASTVLPNGTTAATQASGTNGTTVATTAFVAPMYSPIFGMGSDGALTCSSGTTTLARGMQYTNVTINGSCQIVTANEPIQATGTCDLSAAPTAAIVNNGAAGNSASGATTGSAVNLPGNNSVGLIGSYSPLNATPLGGTGGTGIGANGAGSSTINSLGGGSPGAGSSGGAGSGYAGGTGGSQGATVITTASLPIPLLPWNTFSAGTSVFRSSLSGPGGGAGGGDGTNKGGAGGNGGLGGGNILLACRVITRGSNTNTSIIQAKGGNGGNGGLAAGGNAGGGGGGQGGGGGWVHIIAETLTGSQIANAVDISGGSAGNGGNGTGTGGGGLISAGSSAGGYQLDVISAPSSTMVVMPQGTTGRTSGTAPSGVTGGTGGIGATAQGAL